MVDSNDNERRPLLPSERIHYVEHLGASAAGGVRHEAKVFLTSKVGHYAVLALVSLDISSIFADLLLTSLACEGRVPQKAANEASEWLGVVSLVFSCLFMVELIASVWAFGARFFYSWFHCLDATVIVAGFIIDVLLRGILEEIGSIVVVLRLWRVIKIIEELSAGASEQMEPMTEHIHELEKENSELKQELANLRRRGYAAV